MRKMSFVLFSIGILCAAFWGCAKQEDPVRKDLPASQAQQPFESLMSRTSEQMQNAVGAAQLETDKALKTAQESLQETGAMVQASLQNTAESAENLPGALEQMLQDPVPAQPVDDIVDNIASQTESKADEVSEAFDVSSAARALDSVNEQAAQETDSPIGDMTSRVEEQAESAEQLEEPVVNAVEAAGVETGNMAVETGSEIADSVDASLTSNAMDEMADQVAQDVNSAVKDTVAQIDAATLQTIAPETSAGDEMASEPTIEDKEEATASADSVLNSSNATTTV